MEEYFSRNYRLLQAHNIYKWIQENLISFTTAKSSEGLQGQNSYFCCWMGWLGHFCLWRLYVTCYALVNWLVHFIDGLLNVLFVFFINLFFVVSSFVNFLRVQNAETRKTLYLVSEIFSWIYNYGQKGTILVFPCAARCKLKEKYQRL